MTPGTRHGPWLYTAEKTGRRLTHVPSGWYVPLDCLAWRLSRGDTEAVERAIETASRKPWATKASTDSLRAAFLSLRLVRRSAA